MDFKPDFFHMTMAFLLVFLALLTYRFIRIVMKGSKRQHQPRSDGELLMDLLKERTVGEQRAVADKQASAAALRAMQVLHSHVIEHMPLGLTVVDQEGRMAYVNPVALEILGPPDSSFRLDTWYQELGELFKEAVTKAQQDDHQLTLEVNGIPKSLRVGIAQLPDHRWMMTFQDQTKVVQLEEQVRLKRDLALMGEVASGITHEVKNSLALIQGHVQMLPYGEIPEHSAKIQEEIDRLLECVRQFMQSSKGGSLNLTPVSVAEVFSSLADFWLHHPNGQKVEICKPEFPGVILADSGQLQILFNNLILNGLQACSAMEKEGVLVRVFATEHSDQWQISVEDQGPGFAQDVMAKLFVPFVSTKEGGSGFGLFHCRRIVLQHGGRIEVQTALPTQVCVFFPKAKIIGETS